MNIKTEFITFLKAQTEIGSAVYPNRLGTWPTLPAIVVHRISDVPEYAHHGVLWRRALLQVDVHAKTELSAEVKQAQVITACSMYSGLMGSAKVDTCFLVNVTDGFGAFSDEASEIDQFITSCDFEIRWRE